MTSSRPAQRQAGDGTAVAARRMQGKGHGKSPSVARRSASASASRRAGVALRSRRSGARRTPLLTRASVLTSRPASLHRRLDRGLAGFAERHDRQAQRRRRTGPGAPSPTSSAPGWARRTGARAAASAAAGSRAASRASPAMRRHAQLVHRARRDVGGDADVAVAAEQHQRHGGAVVAGIDREALRRLLDQPAARARCRRWPP